MAVVLSGMSTMEQLEQNLQSADRSEPGLLDGKDMEMIAKVRAVFAERTLVPCTHCDYCMPCPSGVNIPWAFEIYNNGRIYDDLPGARFTYKVFMPDNAHPDKCTGCGVCESKCPQKIAIPSMMPKVHSVLAGESEY